LREGKGRYGGRGRERREKEGREGRGPQGWFTPHVPNPEKYS